MPGASHGYAVNGYGPLASHLQPTSPRTPLRPDSPYPNDNLPVSAVRPAQPAAVPPRSAQRTEMPDRMIRPEPWIGNRQPSLRRGVERTFRFHDPAVQTRGRTVMPDPIIRVHAQSPSRSRSRTERTVRFNTPVVRCPRAIHPSWQTREPPPEPCRPPRLLAAAHNVAQGYTVFTHCLCGSSTFPACTIPQCVTPWQFSAIPSRAGPVAEISSRRGDCCVVRASQVGDTKFLLRVMSVLKASIKVGV